MFHENQAANYSADCLNPKIQFTYPTVSRCASCDATMAEEKSIARALSTANAWILRSMVPSMTKRCTWVSYLWPILTHPHDATKYQRKGKAQNGKITLPPRSVCFWGHAQDAPIVGCMWPSQCVTRVQPWNATAVELLMDEKRIRLTKDTPHFPTRLNILMVPRLVTSASSINWFT